MPEGPFMFFLKEKVQPFVGKTVLQVAGETTKMDVKRLENQVVEEFKTHGKEFLICFPYFTVRIHLMLFGYYLINERKEGGKLRLGMKFDNGELNFYACETSIIDGPLDSAVDWTTDVLSQNWDGDKAFEKLHQKSKLLVCDALLDQDIFAGVGNKLKDEILFEAHVHPESIVGRTPDEKLREIIDLAVKKSVDHLEWERKNRPFGEMKVHYHKTCPRDHNAVHPRTIGKNKRTTYYCDKCQQLYV